MQYNIEKEYNDILVSVIMPVFNSEKYVAEAINSILIQTHRNFEFLIFNDGSTDKSLQIIESFTDPRIKVFSFEKNIGYVKHLDDGIQISKGKYIARMDSDDICMPNRFEKQIRFMESNPDVGVCGTWAKTIGRDGQILKPSYAHDEMIVQTMYFPPIIHPTAIIRRLTILQLSEWYKEEFLYAEDSELWVRISKISKLANLPEILLKYRVHEQSVTSTKWHSHQFKLLQKVRKDQYESLLNRQLDETEIEFIGESMEVTPFNLITIKNFFEDIIKTNKEKKIYNSGILRRFLNVRIAGLVSLKRRLSLKYIISIFIFPFLFYSVFLEKRIYIRAFNKIFMKFKKNSL